MRLKHLMALGGSMVFAVAGMVHAEATPSDAPTLKAQVAALEARLAELEGQQNGNWLNERRAQEVKSLVREVLADADTRASLMGSAVSAGHNGKNFFLASETGDFLLVIDGQIQMRYVANFRDADSGEFADDEHEAGFELRRTKIQFSGHISDPRLTYAIRLAVDQQNSVFADRIRIGYQIMDGWTLWGGEDKAPFLREELTSSAHQLAVERSAINELFTIGRAQGIGINYDSDMFRFSAMISDGANSGEASNTSRHIAHAFESGLLDPDGDPDTDDSISSTKGFYDDRADFAITARLDVKLAGTWDQADDFSAWRGQEMAAFVGAAIHYEIGETGDAFFNSNFFSWTVDASIETGGFNAFVALVGLHTQLDDAIGANLNIFGFVAQAGYMVTEKFEPFIRYEHLSGSDLSSNGLVSDGHINIFTFGANYYLNQHKSKFSLDVVWCLDPIETGINTVAGSGLGLLPDDAGQDNQIAVRAQFQLLF